MSDLLNCRNFPIGRNHLTRDGEQTLCGVPLTSKSYPSSPAVKINKRVTCNVCLKNTEVRR